jgi:acetyl esterase/lipase
MRNLFYINISVLVLSAGVCVALADSFETDDVYNRRIMANEAFYKADLTKDYKLSDADGAGWKKYGALDIDADGQVSFDEFAAKADLPYPRWDGEVKRNVVYKRVGEETLLLDIYEPLVKKYKNAPVFYYTHGGGWSGGRKEITEAERPLFEALSREGFVCVGVMYRLVKMWNPQDKNLMRDCVVDCRDGLRFLKKNEEQLGINMNRVVVFGSSAGGHIAQLLTFSGPNDFVGEFSLKGYKVSPAAGISWFGPSDFRDTRLFATEGLEDKFSPDHWAKRISKSDEFDYADSDAKTKRMISELSPVYWLRKNSSPLLHVHGDQDVVISPNHAHHLLKQADKVGAPVRIQLVEGAGHGWWNKDIQPGKEAIEQLSIDFALKHAAGEK